MAFAATIAVYFDGHRDSVFWWVNLQFIEQ
jgi:hypothetical protein